VVSNTDLTLFAKRPPQRKGTPIMGMEDYNTDDSGNKDGYGKTPYARLGYAMGYQLGESLKRLANVIAFKAVPYFMKGLAITVVGGFIAGIILTIMIIASIPLAAFTVWIFPSLGGSLALMVGSLILTTSVLIGIGIIFDDKISKL
jgi:hypothetical protein